MIMETTPLYIARFVTKNEIWKERVILSLLGLPSISRDKRTADVLLLSSCGQNREKKELRSSFSSRFVANQKKERNAVFLRLSICGRNRDMKIPRSSFFSRFGIKIEAWKVRDLLLSLDSWSKSDRDFGLWSQPRDEGTAALFRLSICGQIEGQNDFAIYGQNREGKETRPLFTSRFLTKSEGMKRADLPSPSELWAKPRGDKSAIFLPLSVCSQTEKKKNAIFFRFSIYAQIREIKGLRISFSS